MMILIFSHMSSTRLKCMSVICMFISARDLSCFFARFKLSKEKEKKSSRETLDALHKRRLGAVCVCDNQKMQRLSFFCMSCLPDNELKFNKNLQHIYRNRETRPGLVLLQLKWAQWFVNIMSRRLFFYIFKINFSENFKFSAELNFKT